MSRWRGRRARLAIAALSLLVTSAATVAGAIALAGAHPPVRLVVRGAEGQTLLTVPLPDGRFTLRYRHSVFGSLAEERFVVGPDGGIELVGLAADQPAVLDEYYAATGTRPAAEGDARVWQAEPATPLTLDRLPLAATEHGRRTLVVGEHELPLWALQNGGPSTVVLEVDPAR